MVSQFATYREAMAAFRSGERGPAAILRPVDGGYLVFDLASDAIGHPSTKVQPRLAA